MDFSSAIKSGFANYVNWNGQASRSEFWYWVLFVIIVSIVTRIIDAVLGTGDIGLLNPLWALATLLPGIFVAVRRLHDTDRSGWWYLLVLTVIGALLLLYWFILKGSDGDNSFGADPLG
ncbi:MAG: DUF805 domain-containing protein [Rhodobacteraceae bacterium]|nr:DUF805 domain-containing protein [Paracoccaceae bacterium]